MGDKLTPKQEAFACAYLETGNASEAYRRSFDADGYSPAALWVKASQLLSKAKVRLRVNELTEMAARAAVVSKVSQTRRLQTLAVKAEALDTESGINAAISAEKEVNKLNGLIVNKSEVTRKRDMSELDDAEIDALIASAESGEGETAGSPNEPSSVH